MKEKQSHKVACHVQGLRPSEHCEDNLTHRTLVHVSERFKGVLLAVLNAYLDESGFEPESDYLCSAAYVFSREGSEKFFKEWDPFLVAKGITTKGAKGHHATDHQILPDAPENFDKLRGLVLDTAERGFLRFVAKSDLKKVAHDQPDVLRLLGSPHALVTVSCMEDIAEYAKSKSCEVYYAIEEGADGGRATSDLIQVIRESPKLREHFAFHRADTYSKFKEIQLQSADLLAWSFNRGLKEKGIPGFDAEDNFPELKNWLDPHVQMKGFSEKGIYIQGMHTGHLGLRTESIHNKDRRRSANTA
jgi:hypothetical protein